MSDAYYNEFDANARWLMGFHEAWGNSAPNWKDWQSWQDFLKSHYEKESRTE